MRYKVCTAILVSVFSIGVLSCSTQENEFVDAKKTVYAYFDYYSRVPFSGHPFNQSIMHPDFVQPGIEGSKYIVISRDIVIDSISFSEGDYNLINPGLETVIKITVLIKQKYVIENSVVLKDTKNQKIDFILSKKGTSNGKYLVLTTSYIGYSTVYQDELESYFAAKDYRDINHLFESYKKAK